MRVLVLFIGFALPACLPEFSESIRCAAQGNPFTNPTEPACEEFATHWDSLACATDMTPPVDCCDYVDYPCDISAYFNCLTDSYSCVDDEQFIDSGADECGVPQC